MLAFCAAERIGSSLVVGPQVTPEDGVTRYVGDRTQGPACAIAAGAGTIFRNYLVPLDGHQGQTAARQLDALAPLGRALSAHLGRPVDELWTMRNGYALCTREGLDAIASLLGRATDDERDALRACLAVGVHRDVAVTDVPGDALPVVTQVYCSALPVAYSRTAAPAWEPFARLVLEAAYEATLLAAAEQQQRGGSATVLLTRLGGGAFGNPDHWIDDAMLRGLAAVVDAGLDVRLVSYGAAHASYRRIEAAWRPCPPLGAARHLAWRCLEAAAPGRYTFWPMAPRSLLGHDPFRSDVAVQTKGGDPLKHYATFAFTQTPRWIGLERLLSGTDR